MYNCFENSVQGFSICQIYTLYFSTSFLKCSISLSSIALYTDTYKTEIAIESLQSNAYLHPKLKCAFYVFFYPLKLRREAVRKVD